MKCPVCFEEISPLAQKCPHCLSNLSYEYTNGEKCLILLVCGIVLAVTLFVTFSSF